MSEESPNQPSIDVLKEQLKELHTRCRWYSSQLWYIPFAYFGIVALVLGNLTKTEIERFHLSLGLFACGFVGVFVLWHMFNIQDGEHRAVRNLQKVEEHLYLERTVELKSYTRPFFIAVVAVLGTCFLAGVLVLCRSGNV